MEQFSTSPTFLSVLQFVIFIGRNKKLHASWLLRFYRLLKKNIQLHLDLKVYPVFCTARCSGSSLTGPFQREYKIDLEFVRAVSICLSQTRKQDMHLQSSLASISLTNRHPHHF